MPEQDVYDSPSNESVPSRSYQGLLLNQTFTLYKSTSLPSLKPSDFKYIKHQLSTYLYVNYQRRSSDMILRPYSSAREVYLDLKVTIQEDSNEYYSTKYLICKCRNKTVMVTQSLIFITKINNRTSTNDEENINCSTIVLSKSTSIHQLLISSLNSISADVPFVIERITLKPDIIPTIINELARNSLSAVGDLSLTYNQANKQINGNLNSIHISIPEADIRSIIESSSQNVLDPALDLIQKFITMSTSLRLQNLIISRLVTRRINLSIDGKFKLSSYDNDANKDINDVMIILLNGLTSV
ncbi:uncharacterized protein RJT21DRAFT_121370 [Scheffersomyces amazonensis]|uniref:uncharacterized protein n=1 Tax=Scheffersomyces amazonensis TaxID=1078765 RepID=UPI00315C8727